MHHVTGSASAPPPAVRMRPVVQSEATGGETSRDLVNLRGSGMKYYWCTWSTSATPGHSRQSMDRGLWVPVAPAPGQNGAGLGRVNNSTPGTVGMMIRIA